VAGAVPQADALRDEPLEHAPRERLERLRRADGETWRHETLVDAELARRRAQQLGHLERAVRLERLATELDHEVGARDFDLALVLPGRLVADGDGLDDEARLAV
jgi:hypothetical protein